MKKILTLLITLLILSIPFIGYADGLEPPVEEQTIELDKGNQIPASNMLALAAEEYTPPAEPEVSTINHRVTITWIFDTEMAETQPPFSGTIIGSTSFDAVEGAVIDMSEYKDHPAGAAYWQPGFINYNGIPCYLCYTYAAGGKGIDS